MDGKIIGRARFAGSSFDEAQNFQGPLVAGNLWVDGTRPGVDAACQGLGMAEALIAQPQGDIEGTGAVVAHDDDGGVGIEFGMGAGGDFAHGHEERVGDAGGLVFPGFADVQQERVRRAADVSRQRLRR